MVPVRDREAIADALRLMLAERDALPGMGRAARAQAEAAFGMEQFVGATEAVYEALLREYRGDVGWTSEKT